MALNAKILVFTAVEVATLVIWLALAIQATDAIQAIIAILVLIGGFTLEHLITFNVVHNRPLFDFREIPIAQKFVVSAIESLIWAIWLVILRAEIFDVVTNLIIATIFLFVTLLVEHTISDNVFTRKPLFSRIFTKEVIGFSIIEAVAAGIWVFYALETEYGFIGIVILAIGSFAEHTFAVNLSKRENLISSNGSK